MNTTQNKPKVFSTDNFSLAIFLKAKGCNMLHVTKGKSRRSFFNFEDSPLRQKLTNDYWNEKGTVEPRDFYRTEKELKMLLYDNSYPTKHK